MSGEPSFSVGPPGSVTDSRLFPVVSPEDEAAFVSGADLGDEHPDNVPYEPIDGPDADLAAEVDGADGPAPTPEDLDALVADVDPDAADDRGFDDADVADVDEDPVTGSTQTGGP